MNYQPVMMIALVVEQVAHKQVQVAKVKKVKMVVVSHKLQIQR